MQAAVLLGPFARPCQNTAGGTGSHGIIQLSADPMVTAQPLMTGRRKGGPGMNRCFRCVLGLILAMACIALCCSTLAAQTASAQDPLVQVLVNKGVLSAAEARSISGTADQQRDRLVQLLKDKGVISAAEYKTVG